MKNSARSRRVRQTQETADPLVSFDWAKEKKKANLTHLAEFHFCCCDTEQKLNEFKLPTIVFCSCFLTFDCHRHDHLLFHRTAQHFGRLCHADKFPYSSLISPINSQTLMSLTACVARLFALFLFFFTPGCRSADCVCFLLKQICSSDVFESQLHKSRLVFGKVIYL